MPFMLGAAAVPASAFDCVVDDPREYHDLFSPPNLPIPTADHAIALAASMLVRDGGTLQIGIGELGDAIVHALTLRHRQNGTWRRALADLGLAARAGALAVGRRRRCAFRAGAVRRLRDVRGRIPRPLSLGDTQAPRRARAARCCTAPSCSGRAPSTRRCAPMPDEERALFAMMPVSFTNELARARLGEQGRRPARCALHQQRDDGDRRRRPRLRRARRRARRLGCRRPVQFRRPGACAAGRAIDHRSAGGARERRPPRIEHPLQLRPRDDPAAPARHRADRVRRGGSSRQERCRGRRRDDRRSPIRASSPRCLPKRSAPASCRRTTACPTPAAPTGPKRSNARWRRTALPASSPPCPSAPTSPPRNSRSVARCAD